MKAKNSKVSVVIVDDHRMVRKALKGLFELESDYQVVADFDNAKSVIQYLKFNKPDIILMDISMPEMDGIEATRIIKSFINPPRVIALTMHKEQVYVKKMLEAGVDGYVDKDSSPIELFIAIDEAMDDLKYFSSKIRLDNRLYNALRNKPILN